METKIVLAGPDEGELMGQAYPALAAAGLEVAAVVSSPGRLMEVMGALGSSGVAVVQVELYATPAKAVEGLAELEGRMVVLLPISWEGKRELFDTESIPGLVRGLPCETSWPQVAEELKGLGYGALQNTGPERGQATPDPSLPRRLMQATRAGSGRAVAFWSGPAGGTGRTMLALALAVLGAERGLDVGLLALSEPAVSAYLCLARVPNVTAFFGGETLERAEQVVNWESGSGRSQMRVLLGPARPQDGVAGREDLAALVEAAQETYELTVVDLPSLTPGGSVWSLEPLLHADDVVLVMCPTTAGVAAAVEALATLNGMGASARVHLILNHRAPGGLKREQFVAGVESLWGTCPEVAAEMVYAPEVTEQLDRGELPAAGDLVQAVDELGQLVAGFPVEDEEPIREQAGAGPTDGRGRQLLGGLIQVERLG